MRPISLAVDVTNYVMLELGQPIHGFDRDKLAGPIVVRRARAGERLTTLDGADRELSTEDLLITDDSGPIGLAGVMGGETTELSETTTNVFIEAAHWDPVTIFRTERRHKLPSEAAKRFERGTDPTIPLVAADRVAELLTTYGGGTVEPGVTYVGARAGPRADRDRRRSAGAGHRHGHLRRDHGAPTCAPSGARSWSPASSLTVTPPPWRGDLTDPFDLVEEVARIVGYANVPSVLPPAAHGRGLTRSQRLRRRIGRTLAGEGFVEVVSFPFVGTRDLDALGLPADDPRRNVLRLANPLSSEEPAMTTTLLPGPAEGRRPQRRSRQRRPGAVRDRHRDAAPGHGSGADLRRRPPADRRRARRARQGAARPAAPPRAGRLRRPRARRLVGRRPAGHLGRRARRRTPHRRGARRRGHRARGHARPVAPRPLCRDPGRRRRPRPRRRAAPAGLHGVRRPGPHRRGRDRPDPPARPRGAPRGGAGSSPTSRSPRRTSPWSSTTP